MEGLAAVARQTAFTQGMWPQLLGEGMRKPDAGSAEVRLTEETLAVVLHQT